MGEGNDDGGYQPEIITRLFVPPGLFTPSDIHQSQVLQVAIISRSDFQSRLKFKPVSLMNQPPLPMTLMTAYKMFMGGIFVEGTM